MTYEEYEGIAKTLTTENAPEVVKQMLDNIKVDMESMSALVQSKTDLETKVRDLQDTNIKLFLSQTGKADDESSEEDLAEKADKEVEDEITNILKGD